jgi:hypothetical protein
MDLTDGEVCGAPLCLSLLPAVAVALNGCEAVIIAVAGMVDGTWQHP